MNHVLDRRYFLKLAGSAAAATVALGAPAFAEWTPRRPVNIILPYSAGGGTDSFARAVASVSDEVLPVPLVVVNKPGSSGITGAMEASRANPDGSTFMLTSAGSFLLTTMLRDTGLDPLEDFRIIGQVGELTTSMMVPKGSPWQNVEDFVKDAKANPGKYKWAHTGRGGFHHIAGQGFLNANGIEAADVPFKGGSNTRAAVIGGQVDFGFIGVQQAAGFENELRVLALNSAERDGIMSDVPTFKEQGFDFADVSSPIIMFAPKDIDDETAQGMEDALKKIATLPAFAEVMAKRGNAPSFLTGEQAAARLAAMKEAAAPIVDSVK